MWDWVLFVGGIILVFIFGVVFGNLLLGVLFEMDSMFKLIYIGLFFGFLILFVLVVGLFFVVMLLNYGVIWL